MAYCMAICKSPPVMSHVSLQLSDVPGGYPFFYLKATLELLL